MRFVVMLIVLAFPVLDVLATVRFARWTGIPITSLKEEETQKLLRVEQELHLRVVS